MAHPDRYQGSLQARDLITPPEGFIPGLKHIYLIIGSGSSDIGKGWLASSIASLVTKPFVIKIDPMLNQAFPKDVGIVLDGVQVTDDFASYRHFGFDVSPKQNLVMGNEWRHFLDATSNTPLIAPGQEKKFTQADFSEYLSQQIITLIKDYKPENVVIEIGGIPSDLEHSPLPAAFRLLGIHSSVVPELIMLSYFEHVTVEGQNRLKAQVIKEGLRNATKQYTGLSLKAVFVRRKHVPPEIPNEKLKRELERIAYETQTDPSRFIFLDNVADLDEERAVVEQSGVFIEKEKPPMISACILGIPCRFDGVSKPVDVGRNLNVLLPGGQALLLCPEVLAGLPVPRGPYQIVGGTGDDVLNGTANVIDKEGQDVTDLFIQGAVFTLKACSSNGVTKAILREKSPSCGVNRLKTLDETQVSGNGVTTALLQRWGIECISSNQI